jgi:glycogen debranching enzyme
VAVVHYARYAFAALPLHAWLDDLCRSRLSPLHAWSEWSLYQVTGDSVRLAQALPVLLGQYARLQAERRTTSRRAHRGAESYVLSSGANPPRRANSAGTGCRPSGRQLEGLYYHAEGESEMDNSPRAPYAWVDLSAQQALAAEHIARIARVLGANAEAEAFETEWRNLCSLIDQYCWDSSLKFYTDCREDGSHQPVKTVAGLWPLLAGVASQEQAQQLAAHLAEPAEFWRVHVFSGLSADHPRYSDRGDRWRGAVWPLHNYAIIKGLERYGLHDLARRAADNDLTTISHVYKETQSHWDNYAPDYIEPGSIARPGALGTGVSAVALLLETILGLTVDAPARTLHWRPTLHEVHTVDRLHIGSVVASLCVEPDAANPSHLRATLRTSAPLTLHVITRAGEQRLVVHGETNISV